jgi:hypothetical protein
LVSMLLCVAIAHAYHYWFGFLNYSRCCVGFYFVFSRGFSFSMVWLDWLGYNVCLFIWLWVSGPWCACSFEHPCHRCVEKKTDLVVVAVQGAPKKTLYRTGLITSRIT